MTRALTHSGTEGRTERVDDKTIDAEANYGELPGGLDAMTNASRRAKRRLVHNDWTDGWLDAVTNGTK